MSGTLRDRVRGKGNSAARLGTGVVDFNLSRLWSIWDKGLRRSVIASTMKIELCGILTMADGPPALAASGLLGSRKGATSRKFGSRLVECRFIKGENMSKAVSLALLGGGILLIVFGVMA